MAQQEIPFVYLHVSAHLMWKALDKRHQHTASFRTTPEAVSENTRGKWDYLDEKETQPNPLVLLVWSPASDRQPHQRVTGRLRPLSLTLHSQRAI